MIDSNDLGYEMLELIKENATRKTIVTVLLRDESPPISGVWVKTTEKEIILLCSENLKISIPISEIKDLPRLTPQGVIATALNKKSLLEKSPTSFGDVALGNELKKLKEKFKKILKERN